MAIPILPEEWFPINLTGINGFLCWSGRDQAFLPANSPAGKNNIFNKTDDLSGSAILPSPNNPLAVHPNYGDDSMTKAGDLVQVFFGC
jgi:hypothetical protein